MLHEDIEIPGVVDVHKLAKEDGVKEPGLGTTKVMVSPFAKVWPARRVRVNLTAELVFTVVGEGATVTDCKPGMPEHERHW